LPAPKDKLVLTVNKNEILDVKVGGNAMNLVLSEVEI
jgi:hypothetical protein